MINILWLSYRFSNRIVIKSTRYIVVCSSSLLTKTFNSNPIFLWTVSLCGPLPRPVVSFSSTSPNSYDGVSTSEIDHRKSWWPYNLSAVRRTAGAASNRRQWVRPESRTAVV